MGEAWQVILDGSAIYSYTAMSDGEPLTNIARALRDLINTSISVIDTFDNLDAPYASLVLQLSATPADALSVLDDGQPLVLGTDYSYDAVSNRVTLLGSGYTTVEVSYTNADYQASTLNNTIIVRRLDGGTLIVETSVGTGSSSGTASVQSVSVYDELDITLSGPVASGNSWSVLLNGEVFTYVAGGNGETTDIGSVDVKIVDNEIAGVLVQETSGSTRVIEPTDLVLLGGGQVTAPVSDGASVNIVLGPASPAVFATVSITSSGLEKSNARATISGTAVWLEAIVALDDNVGAYDAWELTLTTGSTVSTYRVNTGTISTNVQLAQSLATVINTDTRYTATPNDVEYGDGTIHIVDANSSQIGFSARVTQGRASISGSAAWREVNIALSGSIAAGDRVKLTLSSGDGTNARTYSKRLHDCSQHGGQPVGHGSAEQVGTRWGQHQLRRHQCPDAVPRRLWHGCDERDDRTRHSVQRSADRLWHVGNLGQS